MKELAKESGIIARQKHSTKITEDHVRLAKTVCLFCVVLSAVLLIEHSSQVVLERYKL
jgi:hypothetical protein